MPLAPQATSREELGGLWCVSLRETTLRKPLNHDIFKVVFSGFLEVLFSYRAGSTKAGSNEYSEQAVSTFLGASVAYPFG